MTLITGRTENFSKVRRIKVTQNSDRGTIFTRKNLSDGFVEFESLLEESLYLLLDHDPNCIDLESQPIKIPNFHESKTPYVPDAWAKFNDGIQILFDVKPSAFFKDLEKDKDVKDRWEERENLIRKFCDNRGLTYELVTEKELWTTRYENVTFFQKNKRIPNNFPEIKTLIDEFFAQNKEISRIDLANRISEKNAYEIIEIIPIIDHLIYLDYFLLSFEDPITDHTILILRKDLSSQVRPLYQYFAGIKSLAKNQKKMPILEINPKEPNFDARSQKEFLGLEEDLRKEILLRIEKLKIFNKDNVTTEKIQEFARQNKVGIVTLYRWKKHYEQAGWVGLIPQYNKRGTKRGQNAELEELMAQVINEQYLTNTQPSAMGCYRTLLIECEKRNIKKPSFNTFRNRIDRISSAKKVAMRRGRKVARELFKPLNGEYPFGDHPLDLIEIDHTILDVVLVDRVDRKPIGRPVLTVGIDVYSRMIFGYYLSFDPPSLLSVGMCFLSGILPKDQLTTKYGTEHKWVICGLPKSILLDNGKEFRSGALFNFCKLYGINMRFNPVNRPDMKPHVERLMKTINLAIRDDMIKGYVLPIAEKRKTRYNPDEKAELTFEEFETWFVHWITDEYHFRIHSGIHKDEGIEITPHERYVQGLTNVNGKTVGAPTIPKDWGQLRFDLLPFQKRTLQRDGIRLFDLVYYDSIISQIRSTYGAEKTRYLVKYDPRDIREVYLWVDSLGKYFRVPLKNAFLPELLIQPQDPQDIPLALKEYEAIKKGGQKTKRFSPYKLAGAIQARQDIIAEARVKTKTAKRGRKSAEQAQIHKDKATSTEIRSTADQKITVPENENGSSASENEEERKKNLEKLRTTKFPTRSRWSENKS